MFQKLLLAFQSIIKTLNEYISLKERRTAPTDPSIPLPAWELLLSQWLHHRHTASVCIHHPQNLAWLWLSSPMDSKQLIGKESYIFMKTKQSIGRKEGDWREWEDYRRQEVLPFVGWKFSSFRDRIWRYLRNRDIHDPPMNQKEYTLRKRLYHGNEWMNVKCTDALLPIQK